MIKPLLIPGLFITGTDTGVGKTVVAGGDRELVSAPAAARGGLQTVRDWVCPQA